MPQVLIGIACCLFLAVGCSGSFDESAPYEIEVIQHVFGCGEVGVVWVGGSAWESPTKTPVAWLNERQTYEVRIQGDTAQILNGDESVTLKKRDPDDFDDLRCTIPG